MQGAMMDLAFGDRKPVCREDLEEYKRRVANGSPTPMDAMRFAVLQKKIIARFEEGEDKELYSKYMRAIFVLKKNDPAFIATYGALNSMIEPTQYEVKSPDEIVAAQQAIAALEAKLPEKLPEKKKVKQDALYRDGQRVQTRTGKRCGTLDRTCGRQVGHHASDLCGSGMVQVRFDDGGSDTVAATDLQLLCDVSGCNQKGTLVCSKCKESFYCSKECQATDWKARHKRLCGAPKVQDQFEMRQIF
jgi:MYND finger